ncbi:MAG: iron-sulfur cluster assembly scaffold protein [Gammaproteobacteria bacterium]
MSANPFGYPESVWRLFEEPRRAGVLAAPSRTGVASTPANRSRLELQVRLNGARVEDARFRAHGCPISIAVGEWLAERAIGRTLDELSAIRAAEIRQALEIPEDRLHCALLGEDAIKSLVGAPPSATGT